jgi:transcriptional regulator GlxA family with amidase domain
MLEKETSAAEPRLVREAEHLMRTGGPAITVSEVAKALRVSLRSLELGFREARSMTPTQAHRHIRLNAARQALLNSTASTSVTSVALSCGFPHLARFSSYYRLTFGESPNQTLRRCRGGTA